jgi:formylglycine-generating enzyme required for sulfatase activity
MRKRNEEIMKKTFIPIITMVMAGLVLIMGGCENPTTTQDNQGGSVAVSVSDDQGGLIQTAQGARTVLPSTTDGGSIVFDNIVLRFTPKASQPVPLDYTMTAATDTIPLPLGAWDITAYARIQGKDIVKGQTTVTITAEHTADTPAQVSIAVTQPVNAGEGRWKYQISYPAITNTVEMTVSMMSSGQNEHVAKVDVKASGGSGSLSLIPGFYLVRISATGGIPNDQKIDYLDILHVYTAINGIETVSAYTISEDDFRIDRGLGETTIILAPEIDQFELLSTYNAQIGPNGSFKAWASRECDISFWLIDGKTFSQEKEITVFADKLGEGAHYLDLIAIIAGAPYSKRIRFEVKKNNTELVYIAGGTVIGSGTEGAFIEGRTVIIPPYAIARYETIYDLWQTVRIWAESRGYTFANQGREGSHGTDGAIPINKNQPVTNISWRDMIVWCNAYSEFSDRTPAYTYNGTIVRDATSATCDAVTMDKTKDGYRLPTEVEFEFAARGADKNDQTNWNYMYPGSDNIAEVAWYGEDAVEGSTHPVGGKKPNVLGLYDMTGNVWDRVWDRYGYIDANTPIDGPLTGYNRVGKGGCYWVVEPDADHGYPVTWRSPSTWGWGANDYTTWQGNNTGFRVACSR